MVAQTVDNYLGFPQASTGCQQVINRRCPQVVGNPVEDHQRLSTANTHPLWITVRSGDRDPSVRRVSARVKRRTAAPATVPSLRLRPYGDGKLTQPGRLVRQAGALPESYGRLPTAKRGPTGKKAPAATRPEA